MKIKVKRISFEDLEKIEAPKKKKPLKPFWILGALIRLISIPELMSVKFKYNKIGLKRLKEPCLILMNHSSFIDMKIAFRIFFPKRLSIVCTTDAYMGKAPLMRLLGCIPTHKYVTDLALISDISHAIKVNKANVLMYPEARYSFDGRSAPLPPLGILAKKLGVPIVTVITDGAFLRDPLYNCLQKRKVNVTATAKYLLSPAEIKTKSAKEITEIINNEFSFDGFASQQKNGVKIDEKFRADGLERILYRCPNCESENTISGKGTKITCSVCQKEYELDEFGSIRALNGETEFTHIPDWYQWERDCVKKEILKGDYRLETDVEIGAVCDHKALYMIGDGKLIHTPDGFTLTGCDGKLNYTHSPTASHTLNADYFWYEIGDIICIGNRKRLYYCFPKDKISVTKTCLAAEEIYKLKKARDK